MTIATFSLPIDIPWQRIALSSDMIDKVACDRELPLRWRSSIAVFAYEPPEDQQRTDDVRVSYLKVSCTITGFQADGKEIRIREQLGRSGWAKSDLTDRLGEAASAYYACYGAMLEVVVAPHTDDKRFTLAEYPYFADFDPKKRELYEVVTETGEIMSRSLEDVNVRLGQTTLQSHEVMDKTTLGAGLSASYMGVTASGSVANESGTTDLSQQGTENVRTSDAAREARETFSHTTQLSQMYHQLDSYHLGTNRAAFFVLPRPHTVQSPATFVNGPREIEGVQEFMLVVVRPKEMEEFCVEAYLETAHLTGKPIYDWGSKDTQLHFKVESPDNTIRTNWAETPVQAGYVIDRERGPQGVPLGGISHGDTGGYQLTSVTENNIPRTENTVTSDYSIIVDTEQVTVNGWVMGWPGRGDRPASAGNLELSATVYLKKKVPTIVGHQPGLMITGRAVCSCFIGLVSKDALTGPTLVYEKSLGKPEVQLNRERESMPISEANQLGADIKRELLQSLSSADRYPRGTVSLLDSQLFAEMMGTHLRYADRDVNTGLSDWPDIDKDLARRVTAYAPSITRSQLLEMPLARQVESFGLSFAEAVKIRRALVDLKEPQGPPPVPERPKTRVPDLTGLKLEEARAALLSAKLAFGDVEVVDSQLPNGVITGQSPQFGTEVDADAVVTLQVSSGFSVRLPDVLNLPLSEVMCLLRAAGLKSEPTVRGVVRPDNVVSSMEPAPRSWVMPHSQITLRMGSHRKGKKANSS